MSAEIIELEDNEEKFKFLVKLPEENQDEILAYNEIIDIANQYDEELQDTEKKWMFKGITAHKGLLSPKHPNYNGSKYNALVQWEDGSVTRAARHFRER